MRFTHRKIAIIIAFILLFLYQIVPYRKPIAESLWNTFHWEFISLKLDGNNPDLLFSIGNYYFNGRQYNIEKAKFYFQKTLEKRPDFPEAHYQLGRIHFINAQLRSALQEINETILLKPEFEKSYYMYGLISGFKGDLDQAEWGFKEFIKRDDFNWAGYNDLAWVYFKKGDYVKTKEVAETGLSKAYRNPWLSSSYGAALLNLGEKEKAREQFQIALEESEKMTPAQWGGAYPGNDPKIYAQGLEEMRNSIRHNLSLVQDVEKID